MQHPSMSGIDDIESCKYHTEIILQEKSQFYIIYVFITYQLIIYFFSGRIFIKNRQRLQFRVLLRKLTIPFAQILQYTFFAVAL